MFKKGSGNWKEYRKLPSVREIDFHRSDDGPRRISYDEAMGAVEHNTLAALKDAYERGIRWVLFTHGSSTSRLGKTTSRSVVRGVLRSKEATPYICRGKCIQHETVFVAAIRPRADKEK